MSETRITRVEVAIERRYAAWELGSAPSPSCADLVRSAIAALDCDPQTPGVPEGATEDLYALQCNGASVREQAEFLADVLFVCL